MKVLYLSNRNLYYQADFNSIFQPICEPSDLIYKYDLGETKEFLENVVIQQQKHIDFIITDWQFGSQNASDLVFWIRKSTDLYSSKNFQFCSIPIILIEDNNNYNSTIGENFDGVVSGFPSNHLGFYTTVKSVIRQWRSFLADDLDTIGINPKTLEIHLIHRNSFRAYHKLKVLSSNFVDSSSNQLNYIWLNSNHKKLDGSNEIFLDKINSAKHNPIKYLEKDFHDFFKTHKTFIQGEDFYRSIYEPHLYKDGTRRYVEMDFINQPYEYAIRGPEVFEVKRPTQRILRYDKVRFLARARKNFEQVKKYKDYMTSDNPIHQAYVKRYLEKLYSNYEYTLLMGAKVEKEAYQDLIEGLKGEFEFDDINLTTYEELLEKHERLCNRLYEFNI